MTDADREADAQAALVARVMRGPNECPVPDYGSREWYLTWSFLWQEIRTYGSYGEAPPPLQRFADRLYVVMRGPEPCLCSAGREP